MIMKKNFFLFVLLFSVMTTCSLRSYAHTISTSQGTYFQSEYSQEEEVLLQGSLLTGVLRSSFIPFEVTKNAYQITVAYLVNLNDISVDILDESGQLVYSDNVNPVAGGQLLINIANWVNGNYTIFFTNSSGKNLYGTFVIAD
jgi:hypothetical protein